MQVYRAETKEILRRFRLGEITHASCVAALDAALAGLMPRLKAEMINPVREIMRENANAVIEEMDRRRIAKKWHGNVH